MLIPSEMTATEVRNLFENYPSRGGDEKFFDEKFPQIAAGNWYWMQGNGPARVLKCLEADAVNGWIKSTTDAYWYDIGECYRLKADMTEEFMEALSIETVTNFKNWQTDKLTLHTKKLL